MACLYVWKEMYVTGVWLQRNAYLRSPYDFLGFIGFLVYSAVSSLDAVLACGFQKAIKELFGYCETSNESNEFIKFPTPRHSATAGTRTAARGCVEYFCLPLEMASVTSMILRSNSPIKSFSTQSSYQSKLSELDNNKEYCTFLI